MSRAMSTDEKDNIDRILASSMPTTSVQFAPVPSYKIRPVGQEHEGSDDDSPPRLLKVDKKGNVVSASTTRRGHRAGAAIRAARSRAAAAEAAAVEDARATAAARATATRAANAARAARAAAVRAADEAQTVVTKLFIKNNHTRTLINMHDLYVAHLHIIPHLHLGQHMHTLTLMHDQLLEHKFLIKKDVSFFYPHELVQMNAEINEWLERLERMHMDMVPFVHMSNSVILQGLHMHMLEQMHITKQYPV